MKKTNNSRKDKNEKHSKGKLTLLIRELQDCIIKNKELDKRTIIELEAMGLNVYPPTSYPNR